MNKFLLFFVLFQSSIAVAGTYNINQIETVPEFEAIFSLINTKDSSYIGTLDCQSYFNKYDLSDSEGRNIMENFISTGECYYLWENITQCLKTVGSKCIDTNDIFQPDCRCL